MIVIVDYDAGNIGSVINICKKAGGKAMISADPEVIASAGKLILPGVGHFGRAMERLNASGIRAALDTAHDRGAPILGICLGMQLLTRGSEEAPGVPGLGWIDAEARRFDLPAPLKVPHMGWNDVVFTRPDVLTEGLEDPRFYFVHSFAVQSEDESAVLGRTDYGGEFVSVVQSGNVWGFQCHPEKSHKYGLTVIRNFIDKVPAL